MPFQVAPDQGDVCGGEGEFMSSASSADDDDEDDDVGVLDDWAMW